MHEESEVDDSEAGNMRRAIRESISTHASESMNAKRIRGADIEMADDREAVDMRQAISEPIAAHSSHCTELEDTDEAGLRTAIAASISVCGSRVRVWPPGALQPQHGVI